jgi:hypothetical protein
MYIRIYIGDRRAVGVRPGPRPGAHHRPQCHVTTEGCGSMRWTSRDQGGRDQGKCGEGVVGSHSNLVQSLL